MSNNRIVGRVCVFALVFVCAGLEAAESTWSEANPGGFATWSTAEHWIGGAVPELAGDVAIFGPTSPTSDLRVFAGEPITLGGITVDNPHAISIASFVGPTTLDNLGADVAINVDAGSLELLEPTYADAAALRIQLASGGHLELEDAQLSHGGGLFLNGSGTARITGTTNYAGQTVIDGADLSTGEFGLADGTLANGTILRGDGVVRLRGTLGEEHLRVEQGSMTAVGSIDAGPAIDITGQLRLFGDMTVARDLTGAGDLTIDGGTVTLRGDNDHQGLTRVVNGVLHVEDSAALGGNARPLEVEATGTLALESPSLSLRRFERDVLVRSGTIEGTRGILPSGSQRFPSRLAGALTVDGGAKLRNIRIEGPVSGTGGLTTDEGRVFLEGEQVSTYQGVTRVTAGSTLILRHGSTLGATGLGNETVVEAGGALSLRTSENLGDEVITLHGDLFSSRLVADGPLEADVTIDGDVKLTGRYARPIRGSGRLNIVGNTDLLAPMTFDGPIDIADRLILDASPATSNAYRVDGFQAALWANVPVEAERISVVRGELVGGPYRTDSGRIGVIGGRLRSVELDPGTKLIKRGWGRLRITSTQFSEEQVNLDEGLIVLSAILPSGDAPFMPEIAPENMVLSFTDGFEEDRPIHMEGASGFLRRGALRGARTARPARLRGPVHVGQGAVLGGNLRVKDRLIGSNVTIAELPTTIEVDQTDLQGVLTVRDGSLRLIRDGRLSSVEAIQVTANGRLSTITENASPNDMLPDDLPIHVDTGRLNIHGPGAETVGSVHVAHDARIGGRELTILDLTTERDALVGFRKMQSPIDGTSPEFDPIVFLPNADMDRAILGPNILIETDPIEHNGHTSRFATVDPTTHQVIPFISSTNTLVGAEPGDHVELSAPVALSEDTTLATVTSRALDFDGHTLRANAILFNRPLTNGILTGEEMIHLHGSSSSDDMNRVDVQIADGDDGPLDVVVSGPVRFDQPNAFSGKLISHGSIHFDDPRAVPSGTDIELTGGSLFYTGNDDQTSFQTGAMVIREGVLDVGGLAWRADSVRLGGGTIHATPNGDFPVVKDTWQRGRLQGDWSAFTGEILVTRGILEAAMSDLGGMVVVDEDGMVEVPETFGAPIMLRGGGLGSQQEQWQINQRLKVVEGDAWIEMTEEIFVDAPSGIIGVDDPTFADGIDIAENASLRFVGRGSATVREAIHLHDGATLRMFGDNVELDGDLHVSGDTTLHIDLFEWRARPVVMDTPTASIDVIGDGSVDFGQIDWRLPQAHTMRLTRNGQPAEVVLQGREFSGAGTMEADLRFTDGSLIRPEDYDGSADLNVTGDVTFEGDTRYFWSIHDAAGAPGEGFDLMRVNGAMIIEGDAADPIRLRMVSGPIGNSPVDHFNPTLRQRWLVMSSDELIGFDMERFLIEQGNFVDLNPIPDDWRFELIADDNDIFLAYVPEPGTLTLAALGCLFLSHRQRQKATR